MFIAPASLGEELALPPNLQAAPGEGVEADLDELAAQMHGGFPELARQAEGRVQAHAPLGSAQEEGFPVSLGVGGAQVGGALGEAFGRGLAAQRTVGPLMVLALDPAPEPRVEFFQAVDGVNHQTGLEVHLEGPVPALDLAL